MNVRSCIANFFPVYVALTRRVFFGGELPQFLCNVNMLPPCDPSILEQNPLFKRLYENLTTSLLNSDASTRAQSASPARTAVVEVSGRRAICSTYPLDPSKNRALTTLSLGAEAMPNSKRQKANQGANAPAIGLRPRHQPPRGGQYNPHQEETTSLTNIPNLVPR